MATQKRNLKGNRNSDGDFMSVDAMDALVMSTQDMIDAGIPVHEQMVQMDEPPKYMDEPSLDLTEAIRNQDWKDNSILNDRHNKRILQSLANEFGFGDATKMGMGGKLELLQSPEFQKVHGDKYNDLGFIGVVIEKGPSGDFQKDEVGAGHKTKQKEVKDERPGWHKNEGANWWNVDSKSPYWQTEEGYQEAMKIWGVKPGWIKRPSAKKEKVDFKPTKRISL
jgi:hypothetical protein